MSRKSGPRWWAIGSAAAASTSGGTGVGPGVKRYRFSKNARLAPRAAGLAVAVEREDLLVRRAVRPAHGVREQAGREADALLRRVGMPLRRVGPLPALELVAGRAQRRPETLGTGGAVAVAAVRVRVAVAQV